MYSVRRRAGAAVALGVIVLMTLLYGTARPTRLRNYARRDLNAATIMALMNLYKASRRGARGVRG